jgi:hypothetical protein
MTHEVLYAVLKKDEHTRIKTKIWNNRQQCFAR